MSEAFIKFFLAYALGNVMGGQIVALIHGGVDLRSVGSGNVGTTNAMRMLGLRFGLTTFFIDALKGAAAAGLLPLLPWPWPCPSGIALTQEQLAYVCGLGVALGHCYPVTLGFRGGKAVATLLGVCAVVVPGSLPFMLLAFALVVMATGFVSLGSVSAALTTVAYVAVIDARGLKSSLGIFVLATALLVLFKHRRNLIALWRGEEKRFEKVRLIGRWFEQRRK